MKQKQFQQSNNNIMLTSVKLRNVVLILHEPKTKCFFVLVPKIRSTNARRTYRNPPKMQIQVTLPDRKREYLNNCRILSVFHTGTCDNLLSMKEVDKVDRPDQETTKEASQPTKSVHEEIIKANRSTKWTEKNFTKQIV